MTDNFANQSARASRPKGRAYVHQRCRQTTLVTGDDWVGLCNPFCQTAGTYCSHCGKMFSVKEFQWANTHENLLAYIRRVRRRCPMVWRMWFWWLGPLSGALVVALLLYFIGPALPMKQKLPGAAWAALGAGFGLFLVPMMVTPWLVPKATGIAFHRVK